MKFAALVDFSFPFLLFFFFKILFIYLTERQPAREGTQAGGVGEEEAGSHGGAQCGARSQDSGITP